VSITEWNFVLFKDLSKLSSSEDIQRQESGKLIWREIQRSEKSLTKIVKVAKQTRKVRPGFKNKDKLN